MNKQERLARFQATMLDLLAKHSSLSELQHALQDHPDLAEFQDYVQSFDPRMMMIAAELTKKWGVPKSD